MKNLFHMAKLISARLKSLTSCLRHLRGSSDFTVLLLRSIISLTAVVMDTFCRLFVAPQFVQAPFPHPSIGHGFKLQCDRENREHLKNLRNVYCVMNNHSEDWPQNQKTN